MTCTSASSRAPAVSSIHVYKLLQASTDNNTICTNNNFNFLKVYWTATKGTVVRVTIPSPATTFNTHKLTLTNLNQLASTSPCPSNLFSKNAIIMASSLLPLTIQHVIVHMYTTCMQPYTKNKSLFFV